MTTGKSDNVTPRTRARLSVAIAVLQDERHRFAVEPEGLRDIVSELDEAIAVLEAHGADARTREIDRVIWDHGHVSDQVRDLQRAVLRLCDVIDVLMDVARLDRLGGGTIRHLVANEVGRHSGDPIEWVPKRESPFRAEGE